MVTVSGDEMHLDIGLCTGALSCGCGVIWSCCNTLVATTAVGWATAFELVGACAVGLVAASAVPWADVAVSLTDMSSVLNAVTLLLLLPVLSFECSDQSQSCGFMSCSTTRVILGQILSIATCGTRTHRGDSL